MILYSIVPPEVIFKGFEDSSSVRYIEGDYRGERVLVAQMTDGSCMISRLLSTRPASYLDPAFQPGTMVNEKELK